MPLLSMESGPLIGGRQRRQERIMSAEPGWKVEGKLRTVRGFGYT